MGWADASRPEATGLEVVRTPDIFGGMLVNTSSVPVPQLLSPRRLFRATQDAGSATDEARPCVREEPTDVSVAEVMFNNLIQISKDLFFG